MIVSRPLPSIEFLCECFDLNADTGVLIWKIRPRAHFPTTQGWNSTNAQCAGKVAGCTYGDSYPVVGLNGQVWLCHLIVWALAHGSHKPTNLDIDHINGNRSDNRPLNLRVVPHVENQQNRRINSNNTSGVSGVFFSRSHGLWVSTAGDGKKPALRAYSKTFDDAVRKRREYIESNYPGFVDHSRQSKLTTKEQLA